MQGATPLPVRRVLLPLSDSSPLMRNKWQLRVDGWMVDDGRMKEGIWRSDGSKVHRFFSVLVTQALQHNALYTLVVCGPPTLERNHRVVPLRCTHKDPLIPPPPQLKHAGLHGTTRRSRTD